MTTNTLPVAAVNMNLMSTGDQIYFCIPLGSKQLIQLVTVTYINTVESRNPKCKYRTYFFTGMTLGERFSKL